VGKKSLLGGGHSDVGYEKKGTDSSNICRVKVEQGKDVKVKKPRTGGNTAGFYWGCGDP